MATLNQFISYTYDPASVGTGEAVKARISRPDEHQSSIVLVTNSGRNIVESIRAKYGQSPDNLWPTRSTSDEDVVEVKHELAMVLVTSTDGTELGEQSSVDVFSNVANIPSHLWPKLRCIGVIDSVAAASYGNNQISGGSNGQDTVGMSGVRTIINRCHEGYIAPFEPIVWCDPVVTHLQQDGQVSGGHPYVRNRYPLKGCTDMVINVGIKPFRQRKNGFRSFYDSIRAIHSGDLFDERPEDANDSPIANLKRQQDHISQMLLRLRRFASPLERVLGHGFDRNALNAHIVTVYAANPPDAGFEPAFSENREWFLRHDFRVALDQLIRTGNNQHGNQMAQAIYDQASLRIVLQAIDTINRHFPMASPQLALNSAWTSARRLSMGWYMHYKVPAGAPHYPQAEYESVTIGSVFDFYVLWANLIDTLETMPAASPEARADALKQFKKLRKNCFDHAEMYDAFRQAEQMLTVGLMQDHHDLLLNRTIGRSLTGAPAGNQMAVLLNVV